MLDRVKLHCVSCGNSTFYSVPYIEGQIKAMKIHKRDEVAIQMKEKRGPFYDKWLAAMAARGGQKRCGTCVEFRVWGRFNGANRCWLMSKRVNAGAFACSSYAPIK